MKNGWSKMILRHRMNNSLLDISKLEELYYVKRIPLIQRWEYHSMLKKIID